MKTMRTLGASGLFFGLAVFGMAQGSDSFTGTSLNSTNWPGGYMFSGGTGSLSQNGTLQYAGSGADSYAAWGWSGRPDFSTSWSIQVDVLAPTLSLTSNGQEYSVGLYVEGGSGGPNGDYNASMTLGPFFTGGSLHRAYNSAFTTAGSEVTNVDLNTSSASAAVRISYDATTHILSTWYDDDGAANSYVWTPAPTLDITTAWGMSGSDVFSLQVVGSSSNYTILFSDGLALDNFVTTVSAAAVPEPARTPPFSGRSR